MPFIKRSLAIAVATALSASMAQAQLGPAPNHELKLLSSYDSGLGEGATEIVTFDSAHARAFVVNAVETSVDVLDLSSPLRPTLITRLATSEAGALGDANSVAVSGDLVAVAVEAAVKQDPGVVVFYDADTLALRATVDVGALPDMVAFTPDGNTVLVANEGEPNDEYTIDPEGSISVIDLSNGVENATVRTADFNAFDDQRDALIADGVRIFGPNASVSQDLEPEYITLFHPMV